MLNKRWLWSISNEPKSITRKNDSAPYPWVVNELDLEFLIQGFKHLDLNENDLVNYLKVRITLHGKLFGTDELEYAGYFIKHGGLDEVINQKADLIFLAPDYSDIFDEIYMAEKSGEHIKVNVKPAVLINPSQMEMKDISINNKKEKKKIRKKVKNSRKANRRRK